MARKLVRRSVLSTACVVVAAVLAGPQAARADLDSGECVVTVSVSFSNTGLLSGPASFGFSGTGTLCAPVLNTGNPPGTLITTMGISGTGTDTLAKTCGLTETIGTYFMAFGSTWPASSGTFEFLGGAHEASIRLLDTAGAILIGTMQLVLSPLSGTNVGEILDCAGNDMDTLDYVGTLLFSDP